MLNENIHDAGIFFKLLCKTMAEHNKDQWLEWKKNVNTHFIASQIIFVDETSKNNWTIYCHYECAVVGHYTSIATNFI